MSVKVRRTDDGRYIVTIADGGTTTGHGKLDNWIDAAGYAANGVECEANGN